MKDLPLIDISALNSEGFVHQEKVINDIGRAFHEIGFIVIEGHGISNSIISTLRQQVINYFQLPLEQKQKHRVEQTNYRGYIPLGFFTPNASTANSHASEYDQYEGYKLHTEIHPNDPICDKCDLYGPNKWPSQLPELKNAVLDYWRQCDTLTAKLLQAIALYLDLDRQQFKRAFEKPLSNMTLLHYPPRTAGNDPFGIHPHKDTDVLTILAPDPVGGLFVRCKESDEWIAAQTRKDTLIVNVGDMLERWSGGHFVSTPHKVENSSGKQRYSFPYFAVPNFAQEIKPLVSSQDPRWEQSPMHVGDVSAQIWRSNWPNAEAIDKRYDPYTH